MTISADVKAKRFIAEVTSKDYKKRASREVMIEVSETAYNLEAVLYRRFAPELCKEHKLDQDLIKHRIKLFGAYYSNFLGALNARIINLDKYYSSLHPADPLPEYLLMALVREFEMIGDFHKSGKVDLLIRAMALLNRSCTFESWIEKTGTPITGEELKLAFNQIVNHECF